MSGRSRTPGGELRRASQRHARPAVSAPRRISPVWQAGHTVLWKGRPGTFRQNVGDGEHVEIVIDGRVYRVRISELI